MPVDIAEVVIVASVVVEFLMIKFIVPVLFSEKVKPLAGPESCWSMTRSEAVGVAFRFIQKATEKAPSVTFNPGMVAESSVPPKFKAVLICPATL